MMIGKGGGGSPPVVGGDGALGFGPPFAGRFDDHVGVVVGLGRSALYGAVFETQGEALGRRTDHKDASGHRVLSSEAR
jgi:hypothetical protein